MPAKEPAEILQELPLEKRELLFKKLEQTLRARSATDIIPRRGNVSKLPLSFAQERLWILEQLDPTAAIYNTITTIRLKGSLQARALQEAFRHLSVRHEILRTVFPNSDGQAQQRILTDPNFTFSEVDVSERSGAEQDEIFFKTARNLLRQPFDLTSGPLLRVLLFRNGPDSHVLCFSMHHMICDGWSMGVLFKELTILYAALRDGQQPALPDMPIQYADYAIWQRNLLAAGSLDEQKSYWRRQLSGMDPSFGLPASRQPRGDDLHRAGRQLFTISEDITHKLRSLANSSTATLFMVLLAGVKVVLARHAGNDDVVVGTLLANRTRSELEPLIGFFINTLVLRTSLSGNPPFVESLGRVRETCLEAYAHQELPFEQIVEALAPARAVYRMPLFRVAFALQNMPFAVPQLLEMETSSIELDLEVPKFELNIAAQESGDGLSFLVEFDETVVDTKTIARLLAHLKNTLAEIAERPEKRIYEIPMLSSSEQEHILKSWNLTYLPRRWETYHDAFLAAVCEYPDALAVLDTRKQLTFSELAGAAANLSYRLRRLGAGLETPIGLAMRPSVDFAIGLLAIVQMGSVAVPLDLDLPLQRLAFLMKDSGVRIVIAAEAGNPLPSFSDDITILGIEGGSDDSGSESFLAHASEDNLVYVMYTSGSSGQPKGVAVTHRGAVNFSLAIAKVYELGPEDRVLQFGSISADIVISQLFPAWISGSAVVFPDSRLPESLDAFLDFLESKRLSVLDLPTAFWLRWVLELAQTGKTLPKSLRMVIAGGEQAPMKAYETWLQMAGTRVRFLHAYGPTETTVAACAYDPIFGTRSHEWDLEIPIGRALENVRLYVLGQGLQPVSIGMPGELYIGGAGLARGYLGQPGLTAEVFVPDPFCGVAGDRMYKSGDRVRLLQSGDIEFMGRVDEQVKIRGNRVELGEIEAVLSQHPDVRQAIVLARTQGDNEKRLAAYLVVDDEARCDITALRSYLRQRVPEYQIPSTFSFLRALPITATGKVDRKALLSLRDAEAVEQKEVVSPGNETEKMLADIWSELLQTPAIGIHDNFFELGGDSLIGLQMVARGRGRGLEIKSQDVFRYQTIAEMAVVVEGRRREGGEGREKEKVGEVGGEVKLTAIQRWFVEQGFAEREHYNQSLLLEAGAEVKYEGVAEVVRKLVEHHDGLRLRLRREGGEWRQENAAEEKAEIFERVEAGGRSRKEQEQVLRETGERLQKGMNLERGPIVRGAMVERGGKEGSWVMLVVHHWAVDNLSWRILVEDLERGYEQWQRREGVDFGEKTASFQQWAAAAEGYGKSEQVKEELEYWKGEVERGREGGGEIGEEEGGGENVVEWERRVVVEMDEGETRGLLEEVTQWHRAQTQEVLLAGVWEGFRRWEGRRVLRLEVEGHGREEVLGGGLDVTRTVGWFTAQYPMVVEGGEEWRETLQRVKQQWRKVPGRGVGYGLLRYVREEAEIREVLGGDGQVSFNYFGQMSVGSSGGRFRMLGAAPGEGQSRRARRPYLLDLTLMVIAGRLNLQVGYSEKVHRQQNIEQLAGHVMQALRDLLEYSRSAPLPAFSPSDFPLARLNDAELASLTVKLTGLPENE